MNTQEVVWSSVCEKQKISKFDRDLTNGNKTERKKNRGQTKLMWMQVEPGPLWSQVEFSTSRTRAESIL